MASAPYYYAEIWDNKLCDDCDPVATGDPVKVVDSDFGGIDFQLKLKPPETIFDSGFE
jgi:hypothetical protein